MIEPHLENLKEIERQGLTKEQLLEAAKTYSRLFGDSYLLKEKSNHRAYHSHSLWHLFAHKPMFRWLTSSIPDDLIMLVETANLLNSFEKQSTFPTYIQRLKDDNNNESAWFELLIARYLKELGGDITLQKDNPHGNPVEIHLKQKDFEFWTECKINHYNTPSQPYHHKLISKLILAIKILPPKTVVYVHCFEKIQNESQLKIISHETHTIINKLKKFDFLLPFRIKTSYGYVGFLRFSDEIEDDVMTRFRTNNITLMVESQVPKETFEKGIQQYGQIEGMQRVRILAVHHPKDHTISEVAESNTTLKEIKNKIEQQKSLLENGNEVIIIFKKTVKNKTFDEVVKGVNKRWKKYNNLSILYANYFIKMGRIELKFTPLIVSEKVKILFGS